MRQARLTMSSDIGSASTMTPATASAECAMSITASMSLKTTSSSLDKSAPAFSTKSIWLAPCSSALLASNALTARIWEPLGKPTTVPRRIRDLPSARRADLTNHGLTVRATQSCSTASANRRIQLGKRRSGAGEPVL